jgi:hypothetical protein
MTYSRSYDICVKDGIVFLPLFEENKVVLLDAKTLEEKARFDVPSSPHGCNIVGDKVVVSCYKQPSVAVYDGSGFILKTVPVSSPSICQYKGKLTIAGYAQDNIITEDGMVLYQIHQPHSIWSTDETLYIASRGDGVVVITPDGKQSLMKFGDPLQARVFNGSLYVADYATKTLQKDGKVIASGPITSMWVDGNNVYYTIEGAGNPVCISSPQS